MLVLAIECSSPKGSVALYESGVVLAKQEWLHQGLGARPASSQHGELLVSSLKNCLASANKKVEEVNLIAVGNGPGRFTGVRVAINCARTLSFALRKKIIAFSSLEILASSVSPTDLPVLGIFNAHKNSVYAQEFDVLGGRYRPKSSPQVWSLNDLEDRVRRRYLCLGDGYDAYQERFSNFLKSNLQRDPSLSDFPDAAALATIASQDFDPVTTLDWESLKPLYIRASEAEEKLKAGSLQEVMAPNRKQ